eukprot:PhF_6_TR7954/c0_g1_i1/m.12016
MKPAVSKYSNEVAFTAKNYNADFEQETKIGVARTLPVNDPIGPEIRAQIKSIEKKVEGYVYTPIDSRGGTVPNDGTDGLYRYQSNFHYIKEVLTDHNARGGDGGEEGEGDDHFDDEEEEEYDFASSYGDAALRKRLNANLSPQQVINRTAISAMQTKVRALVSFLRALDEGTADVEDDDMQYMKMDNEELNLDGMEDNAQIALLKMTYSLKVQQCNALIKIVTIARDKLKLKRNRVAYGLGAGAGAAEVEKLQGEIQDLQKEREFLYYKVYGAQAPMLLGRAPAKITDEQLSRNKDAAEADLRKLEEEERRKQLAAKRKKAAAAKITAAAAAKKLTGDDQPDTPRTAAAKVELNTMVHGLHTESPGGKQKRKELRLKLQAIESMCMEMHDTLSASNTVDSCEPAVNQEIDDSTDYICKKISESTDTLMYSITDAARRKHIAERMQSLTRCARIAFYGIARMRVVQNLIIPFDLSSLLNDVMMEIESVVIEGTKALSSVRTDVSASLATPRDDERPVSPPRDDLEVNNDNNDGADNSERETPRQDYDGDRRDESVSGQCDADTQYDPVDFGDYEEEMEECNIGVSVPDPDERLVPPTPQPQRMTASSPKPKRKPVITTSTEVQAVPEVMDNEAQAAQAITKTSDTEAPKGMSITFVFTDVQSSVKLWEHVPDAMARVAVLHRGLMRDAISAHNGYEVRSEGEAFFVAFASTSDALHFCLSVQERLVQIEYPEILRKFPDGVCDTDAEGQVIWNGIRVRMGIHKGSATAVPDPITHRMDYFGVTVTRAARIAAHARGGQILISAEVQHTVKERVRELRKPVVRDLGHVQLRSDKKETMQLYSLLPSSLSGRNFPIVNPEDRLLPSLRGVLASRWVMDLDIRSKDVCEVQALREAPTHRPALVFIGTEHSSQIADIMGSAYKSFLRSWQEAVRELLVTSQGYEVKYEGWELFVAFPTPKHALEFAVLFQEYFLHWDYPDAILKHESFDQMPKEVTDESGPVRWRGLRFRIGIHAGEVDAEMDPATYRMDYSGPAVNKAARIESSARAGQIALSVEAYDMLGDTPAEVVPTASFHVIGFRQIKGLSQPVKLIAAYPVNLRRRQQDIEQMENDETAAMVDITSPRSRAAATRWGVEALRKNIAQTNATNEFAVTAPQGEVVLVFTDIQGSNWLWENCDSGMYEAVRMHHDVMREGIQKYKGYEVRTDGDAFMVAFNDVVSAVKWSMDMQRALLHLPYAKELLRTDVANEVHDATGVLLWRGLRVRMGLHIGVPLCEVDGVAYRMRYSGPVVAKAARITGCGFGGELVFAQEDLVAIQEKIEEIGNTFMYDVGPCEVPNIGSTRLFALIPAELSFRQAHLQQQRIIANTPNLSKSQASANPIALMSVGSLGAWVEQTVVTTPGTAGTDGTAADGGKNAFMEHSFINANVAAVAPLANDAYFMDEREMEVDGSYALGVPRMVVEKMRELYPMQRVLARKIGALRKFPVTLSGEAFDALNELEYAEAASKGQSHIQDIDQSLCVVLSDTIQIAEYMMWLTKDVQENSSASNKLVQTLITVAPSQDSVALKSTFVVHGEYDGSASPREHLHKSPRPDNNDHHHHKKGGGGGGSLAAKLLRPHNVPTSSNMMLAEIKRLREELETQHQQQTESIVQQQRPQSTALTTTRTTTTTEEVIDFSSGTVRTGSPPKGVNNNKSQQQNDNTNNNDGGGGVGGRNRLSSGPTSRRWSPLFPLLTQYEKETPRTIQNHSVVRGVDASNMVETLTGPFSLLKGTSRPSSRQEVQRRVLKKSDDGDAKELKQYEPPPGTVLYYAQRRQLAKLQITRKPTDP